MADRVTRITIKQANVPIVTTAVPVMNITWDNVYWLSQFVAVFCAGVALVSGAVVNKRQSAEILTLSTKLEEQREKSAKAEESLMRMRLPRWITDESLVILRNAPTKAPVEILYLDGNQEAYLLAQNIRISFEMTGWPVVEEKPTDVTRTPNLGVRLEVGPALYKEQEEGTPLQLEEPAKSLWEFFQANLQSATTGGFKVNKGLPPNAAVIVIGPKTM